MADVKKEELAGGARYTLPAANATTTKAGPTVSSSAKPAGTPFEAALTVDGIVLSDPGEKHYQSLNAHPKVGQAFKAGKRLKLPAKPGSRLKIVGEEDKTDVIFDEAISHLEIAQILGQINVLSAECDGKKLTLPPLPRRDAVASRLDVEQQEADTGAAAKAAAKRLAGKAGMNMPGVKLASSEKAVVQEAPPPARRIDPMAERELRALISDEARKQYPQRGWAVVLKELIDKRIEQMPAVTNEPLAAGMLKGIVEGGVKDPVVHEAVCKFCVKVGNAEAPYDVGISQEVRDYVKSINNFYDTKPVENKQIAVTSGMNLFEKALQKLGAKAFTARIGGIEYISKQAYFEASKMPKDPEDQVKHIQRIKSAIAKVEGSETFKNIVDLKQKAGYQEGLDRAKRELSRFEVKPN